MSDSVRLWSQLANNIRAASFRREREYFGAFVVFWILLMLIAAGPTLLTLWLQGFVGDGAAQTVNTLIPTEPLKTELAASACIKDGAIIACPVGASSSVDLQAVINANLLFLTGICVFWVLGLGIIWSQARACRQYWAIVNEDRCNGISVSEYCKANNVKISSFRLFGPRETSTVLLVIAVLFGCAYVIQHYTDPSLFFNHPNDLKLAFVSFFSAVVVIRALVCGASMNDKKPPEQCRANLASAVRLLPLPTLAIGFTIGTYAVSRIAQDHPNVLHFLPNHTTSGFLLAATVAIFFTATVSTALATYCYGWDFPSRDKARKILVGIADDQHRAGDVVDQFWGLMKAGVKHCLKETGAESDSKRASAILQATPVLSRQTGASADSAIRVLATPLAVLIVAALVVLALGQSMIEATAPSQEPAANEPSAQLIWLSFAMTLTFAIIVVWPLVRVGPFVPSNKTDNPARDWHVLSPLPEDPPQSPPSPPEPEPKFLTLALASQTSVAARAKADKLATTRKEQALDETRVDPIQLHTLRAGGEDLATRTLRRHIGADQAKLKEIFQSVTYSAILQSLMGETLKGRIASILTILAPAAVTAFIEFIK